MGYVDDYLKQYGFIIPGNEIYGGCRGLYDYGHLGVILKNKIQKKWEEYFALFKDNIYFFDGSILGSEECWKASGHLENFHDVLVDCKNCKRRFREDHIKENTCSHCGGKKWTDPKEFNLIFKTMQENLYLRPETAQSIFINFKNIARITNAKIPFGVAQIGKSFRNEITMNNSIFRTLEFEQMELEWFTSPEDANDYVNRCSDEIKEFLTKELEIPESKIKIMEITKEERAHYSIRSIDFFFSYEFGWSELWGLSNRGQYDLSAHQRNSGRKMEYLEQNLTSSNKFIPNVVEHSVGLNRLMYAVINSALKQEDDRIILKIKHDIAPYYFAVLPLTKNEEPIAESIHKQLLSEKKTSLLLRNGSIGKRYRHCDAIGVPYCITIDENSSSNLSEATFTIRDRDTKKQIRMSLKEMKNKLYNFIF